MEDAREPAEGAPGVGLAELHVVVVHDAALPPLVHRVVRREEDVELTLTPAGRPADERDEESVVSSSRRSPGPARRP